jgi:hypothetical protein
MSHFSIYIHKRNNAFRRASIQSERKPQLWSMK